MSWLRRVFMLSVGLVVLASGLWLVVVNNQPLRLNLFMVSLPSTNAGFAVLVAFALGALVGILVGLNLFTVFRLNSRVFWLKRELRQLQDDIIAQRKA